MPANDGDGEDGGGSGRGTLATAGAGAPRGERGRAHPGDGHLTRRGIGSGQERLRHEATQHDGGQHDHHRQARTERHGVN